MKKVLVLFSAMTLMTGVSLAYIEDTSNIDNLRTQGYSESLLRSLDLVKVNSAGTNGNYQRRFPLKRKSAYSNLKVYWDPIQDDGEFGVHQVDFSNTWMGGETSYSSRFHSDKGVDNL